MMRVEPSDAKIGSPSLIELAWAIVLPESTSKQRTTASELADFSGTRRPEQIALPLSANRALPPHPGDVLRTVFEVKSMTSSSCKTERRELTWAYSSPRSEEMS